MGGADRRSVGCAGWTTDLDIDCRFDLDIEDGQSGIPENFNPEILHP